MCILLMFFVVVVVCLFVCLSFTVIEQMYTCFDLIVSVRYYRDSLIS